MASSFFSAALWALAAAACLRCPREAAGAAHLPDPGPCVPPRDPSAPTGLRGYRRFHANDSLIGRPVPCTRDDKICFRHNLLFDPQLDRCEPLGGGKNDNCDLKPSRTEFEHGSGRLVGVCRRYRDPCPGYRMAFDGRCYRREVVRDVLCGCGAAPASHFLGGAECRTSPATPKNVQQPTEEHRCAIPNLRFPDAARSTFFENPFSSLQGFRGHGTGINFGQQTPRLKCEAPQAACFAKGLVWVKGRKNCYKLLERGPCSSDHVVALKVQAAMQGRAEATCLHVRGGCLPGQKRMVFDDKCYDDREMMIAAPGDVVQNQYGQHVLIPRGFLVWFRPTKVASDYCEIDISAVGDHTGDRNRLPKPPCGSSDSGFCHLYEVQAEAPNPLDD